VIGESYYVDRLIQRVTLAGADRPPLEGRTFQTVSDLSAFLREHLLTLLRDEGDLASTQQVGAVTTKAGAILLSTKRVMLGRPVVPDQLHPATSQTEWVVVPQIGCRVRLVIDGWKLYPTIETQAMVGEDYFEETVELDWRGAVESYAEADAWLGLVRFLRYWHDLDRERADRRRYLAQAEGIAESARRLAEIVKEVHDRG
jgi:hypothetical protein